MVRKPEQDEQRATVSVSGVAFALMALDLPVWMDAPAAWEASDAAERNEYMARARYLVDIAESTGDAPDSGLRWLPEDEVRRRGLESQVIRGGVISGQVVLPRMSPGPSLAASAPHPVQLGDQRAECTCGRWQFEETPEPSKHLAGCAVQQMVEWVTPAELRTIDADPSFPGSPHPSGDDD